MLQVHLFVVLLATSKLAAQITCRYIIYICINQYTYLFIYISIIVIFLRFNKKYVQFFSDIEKKMKLFMYQKCLCVKRKKYKRKKISKFV